MTALRYTEDHEWIRPESDGSATVGITDHAQDALGDIVFVEMPEVGRRFSKGEPACVIESVKAAADLKMPLSGSVVAVNDALPDDPAKVNTDPMNDGWFIRIQPDNPADLEQLMDDAAYQALIAS